MLRALMLLVLPLFLFLIACGGASNDNGATESGDNDSDVVASDAGPDGIYGTRDDGAPGDAGDGAQASDPADDGTRDVVEVSPGTDAGPADDTVATVDGFDESDVLGALNPFTFLGGITASPSAGQVDPELGSPLLTSGDLQGTFTDMGEFSFTEPSEFGEMTIAARMFGAGVAGDDFDAMVVSAAIAMPEAALGNLEEFGQLTEADLPEAQAEFDQLGLGQIELSILDASGLGEDGFGTHMEMDFGELISSLAAPDEDVPFTGVEMDMYGWVVGDRLLMVMVMWPMGGASGVDSRGLAETMDARA